MIFSNINFRCLGFNPKWQSFHYLKHKQKDNCPQTMCIHKLCYILTMDLQYLKKLFSCHFMAKCPPFIGWRNHPYNNVLRLFGLPCVISKKYLWLWYQYKSTKDSTPLDRWVNKSLWYSIKCIIFHVWSNIYRVMQLD